MRLLPCGKQSGLFVFSRRARVLDCLVNWGNEWAVGRAHTHEEKTVSLQRAFEFLDDRKVTPDRAILIDIFGGWTAFFDNHSHEYLAQAELFVLCERLGVVTCFFSHNGDAASPQFGSSQFCHFTPTFETNGVTVQERQVMVYKESGWTFSQNGDPLPFEHVDRYASKRKKDRLDAELLREYGKAIDLPFWDEKAYGHGVSLLRWRTQ